MARVTFNHARHTREMMQRLNRTMRAVSLEGERIAKTDVLNKPGKGKPYVRSTGGIKRKGIASAPGDPPAPDTGTLRGRVSSETLLERDAVTARASVLSDYAKALDEGTDKMAPRPFREKIRRKMLAALRKIRRRYL